MQSKPFAASVRLSLLQDFGQQYQCHNLHILLQGMLCGEQPYKVLVACVLVIGLCCLGLLRFDVETDPQRLWVGSGSLAAREKAQYEVQCHCADLLQVCSTGACVCLLMP